jgi:tetratricopeptide (TPR) repeat protein
MREKTIFISYAYSDNDAKQLLGVVQEVAARLQRVNIVDGRTLDLRRDFSGEISQFIRDHADCLVGILLDTGVTVTNIVYEVGVAIGAGKDLILISDSLSCIPAMLRSHDAVVFNREQITWRDEFAARLEHKLRSYLQIPSDHLVEDKIRRRYLDEELLRLRDRSSVIVAIDTIRMGDLPKARALLQRLIERDPSNADAHYLLADTLYLMGCASQHPLDREQFFNLQLSSALAALKIDPNHVLALNVKSNAEIRLGKVDEARATLEQARLMDPDFSVPIYNSACLSAILGERKAALRDLREAIEKQGIWKQFAKGDPDFAKLRSDGEWLSMVYDIRRE